MLPLFRDWTAAQRTPQANLRLGGTLAFVAGATNAGGFLAVGRYTSHMTGIVSAMADDLVLGQVALALAGLAALGVFILGAMTTAVVVNWAQRRELHSRYALPLLIEAGLLLVFGLLGATLSLHTALLLPATVLLLCFIMGLQNAVITKISKAEIRTTHVTGLVTDLGIELGKWLYVNRSGAAAPVRADRRRLRTQGTLLGLFFVGGVVGALGFQRAGYITTVPLALLLALLALRPLLNDLRRGPAGLG
ncbi:YoaK family protein [Piscinibacter sakaiensis]|uniref:Putative transmembrane protein n=1 Tax=Piscinibacter sakaiensis TaxID=1547922 RepID=A0A0K8NTZ0_PISS1|nr:YoaK family protein [Piscinibacter sakaiensis]GAP33719.1 putative transmembrane protein [Piscinibacter sakaiensis]